MAIQLSEKADLLLTLLSEESEIAREKFLEDLLETEDRKRHIIKPPHEDERRTCCILKKCKEEDTRPAEEYEV